MQETQKRTPIPDADKKTDLIEHINDGHVKELLIIAHAHGVDAENDIVVLKDVFEEGCLITYSKTASSASGADDTAVSSDTAARKAALSKPFTELFIPFNLEGDLEEKVLYLAYEAMVRQGKSISGQKKQYFEVLGSEKVSPNILRLKLKSHAELPENEPGYAWFFALTTLKKIPEKKQSESDKASKPMQLMNRVMLWWIRRLSPKKREKMMLSFSKGLRYYTLRKAEKDDPGLDYCNIALVDVFLHGDTPGSVWASQLKAGDIIHSKSDYKEQTNHLHEGQALLIADETSLPAAAAILDDWHNPLPPLLIVHTHSAEDQAYLPDSVLPSGTVIKRLSGIENVAQAVINCLGDMPGIEKAWGAMEKKEATTVRHYIRKTYGLKGAQNRIKGYWRLKEDDDT